MKWAKKISYSIIFALIIFFISMFINIIPCQTAPNIPNPQYNWNLCSLNPDLSQEGTQKLYLGYISGLRETFFTIIFVSFILAMIVLYFIARKKE